MTANLKTRCTHCHATVKIGEEVVGKRVRCPACKQPFEVASVAMAFGDALAPQAEPRAAETLVRQASDTDIAAAPPTKEPAPPVSPVAPPSKLGQLGRFELKELLGQGAFGRVYRAYDPQLDRFVALKVPTFDADETHKINRFAAEAKAAAKLRHPSIVPTYESGQVGGRYYIAAQFVPGKPLSRAIKDSPPDFRQSAIWVRQLAEALAYAHGEGIVHRDIKPANVMINEKGIPQIMDFGLAKRLNEDSAMTTDGSILGTPAYMAPEQARGELAAVGPASDQYSLGVVLYELLTGKKPFDGAPHAVIAKVIGEEPPAPRSMKSDIPPDLASICQKAMSKDAAGRYASVTALAEDLARWLRGEGTLARPMSSVERASRWCRKNPLVAALGGTVVLVTLAGLTGVSLALWQTNQARLLATSNATLAENQRIAADEQRILANTNFQEADRQRKLTQQSLADAELQRQAAEASQKLAEQRAAEAKAAKEEAEGNALELATALSKLKAETDARLRAEQEKTTLESTKADLEQTAAKLASENEAAVLANADAFYRDRLVKAQAAIQADELKQAHSLLEECPADARHWEWKYLMAKVKKAPRLQRTAALATPPETLRYSERGDWLVLGSSQRSIKSLAPLAAWNATCHSTSLNFADVPVEEGRKRGGHVCSLTAIGTGLLTVNNAGSQIRAHPQYWEYSQGGWKLEKEYDYLNGYALDCGMLGGEWVVLTTDLINETDLGASVKLQFLSKRKPIDLNFSGPVLGARLDADMSHLQLIVRERTKVNVSVSHYSVLWRRVEIASGRNDFAVLWENDSHDRAPFRDPWRLSLSQGEHLCAWKNSTLTPQRNRTGTTDGAVVIHDGKKHDQLSKMLAVDADALGSFATFTGDGKRLIVASPSKGLEVYRPLSPDPTRPLLVVPINNTGGPVIMQMDSSGLRLTVAIGTTVTMFDVSGGK